MDRRKFLATAGSAASVAVAGCSASDGDDEGTTTRTDGDEDTLVVATYGSFIDSPSSSPGAWLKQRFEEEHDARVVYQTPSNELNHYVERQMAGVGIDADLYLGLNTEDLVRVDERLDGGLFVEAGDVDGLDAVKSGLDFDPADRAVPYDTGYVSLVYDGTRTTAPETFAGLLDEEHEGDLIAQNPSSSSTGRAFLLHTVHEYGEDGYLDYWADLQSNGVTVLGEWGESYTAWENGEAPMVVSYSTDRVFADQSDADMEKHRIRFLEDEAYANPEGMAVFEDAARPDLARDFMEFVLRPEIQGELAVQNVQFPATTDAALPEDYADLARSPPEPVTFTYDELQGSVSGWIEDWSRQFASN